MINRMIVRYVKYSLRAQPFLPFPPEKKPPIRAGSRGGNPSSFSNIRFGKLAFDNHVRSPLKSMETDSMTFCLTSADIRGLILIAASSVIWSVSLSDTRPGCKVLVPVLNASPIGVQETKHPSQPNSRPVLQRLFALHDDAVELRQSGDDGSRSIVRAG